MGRCTITEELPEVERFSSQIHHPTHVRQTHVGDPIQRRLILNEQFHDVPPEFMHFHDIQVPSARNVNRGHVRHCATLQKAGPHVRGDFAVNVYGSHALEITVAHYVWCFLMDLPENSQREWVFHVVGLGPE